MTYIVGVKSKFLRRKQYRIVDTNMISVTKDEENVENVGVNFFNHKYCGNRYYSTGLKIGEYKLRGLESLKIMFKSARYSSYTRKGFLIEYQYY